MKEEVNEVKQTYMPGTRIRLLKMVDMQAPPVGSEGAVRGVDDAGQGMGTWDTGSSLSVVLDMYEIEVVEVGR